MIVVSSAIIMDGIRAGQWVEKTRQSSLSQDAGALKDTGKSSARMGLASVAVEWVASKRWVRRSRVS